MFKGKVTSYDVVKGFGFIRPDDGGPDIFLQRTALTKAGITTLKEGDYLRFDVVENPTNGKVSADNIEFMD